jgi:hypothetical protein
MRRFGGYCLGCASESWSNLSRVIGRDHFWSFVLVVFAIVCGIRSFVVIVSAIYSAMLVRRTIVVLLCCFTTCAFFIVCHRMRSSWSLSWWLDQLSHFEHQKVGKNTCEVPIQILYVGLGASIFTFMKTCVERYGSQIIFERSAVMAVDIDLGVACFVDESFKGFVFAVVVFYFH